MFRFKHWMKHTAMVPKGFLRYKVLKMLSEKPMSGSEMMNEIAKQTNGHWRPSPGSIYPLLAWLEDNGYIKEVAEQEAGVKRYSLTDQGRTLLQELDKKREEMRGRFRHFGLGPGLMGPMGPMWFEFYPERPTELRRAMRNLAIALWKLRDSLREEYSEKAAEEARKALEEATAKIEDIMKKI